MHKINVIINFRTSIFCSILNQNVILIHYDSACRKVFLKLTPIAGSTMDALPSPPHEIWIELGVFHPFS